MKRPIIAICYDFDGTLSPGNMQEYDFFSSLGCKKEDFWAESSLFAKEHHVDPILSYMRLMIRKANEGATPTTLKALKKYGKSVELFPGVKDWFDRVSRFGEEQGACIEHYIVSSGLKEMIEGTSIGKKFKKIYACSFVYDNNDVPEWPAVAVNYTTKTQFLFRINKGITQDDDHLEINAFLPDLERRIPFSRMLYIGDGATDVPCMRLVKEKGGVSIAVFDPAKPKKKRETLKLLAEGRVHFVAEAIYQPDSRVEKIVKAVICSISARSKVEMISTSIRKPKSRPGKTVPVESDDVTLDNKGTIEPTLTQTSHVREDATDRGVL